MEFGAFIVSMVYPENYFKVAVCVGCQKKEMFLKLTMKLETAVNRTAVCQLSSFVLTLLKFCAYPLLILCLGISADRQELELFCLPVQNRISPSMEYEVSVLGPGASNC